jgi:hypothetical protein
MGLQKGGGSWDFFFVAMAYWQLGQPQLSRDWYRRAVEWMEKQQPKDEELLRFRAEAAGVLGMNEPK